MRSFRSAGSSGTPTITKNWDEAIQHGQRLLKLDPTDIDVATLVVKAMIRVGREADAAASLLDWFRTGNMPPSGATQGILSAVMLNQKVKQSLDAGFPKLVEANPKQVFVRLAFAAFLSEAGKGDDAWREFHEAEKGGLCDATSGGRHPLAQMLVEEVGRRAAFPGRGQGERPRRARQEVRGESRPRRAADPRRAPHRAARHRPAPRKEAEREDHRPRGPRTARAGRRPLPQGVRDQPRLLAAALPCRRARDRARPLRRGCRGPGQGRREVPGDPPDLPGAVRGAVPRRRRGRRRAGLPQVRARRSSPARRPAPSSRRSRTASRGLLAPFAEALEKDMAAQPKNARLRSHLAMLRIIQGDRPGAQKAAASRPSASGSPAFAAGRTR